MTISQFVLAQSLTWHQLPPIPDSVGFAGSLAGVSQGALLVGGGANFPDNVGPWGNTPKTWYDDVFVLEKAVGGVWKKAGKLPRKIGYSLALTIPEGVLCIGGADAEQHYTDVFVMSYGHNLLSFRSLASLTRPLANACGAILNGVVYVAGGLETPTDTTAEHVFLSLDLTNPTAQWQTLSAWPGSGRMLAVAGVQAGKFYLFSGTEIRRDAQTGTTKRYYLTDAYAYDPALKSWQRLADLPRPAVAAPSPAFAAGKNQLLVCGGDDGLNADKNLILKEKHPGFHTDMLVYNSQTNTWTTVINQLSEQPGSPARPARWAPVTTPLVVWDGKLILPGGEIRPGVRTNRVLVATPEKP